MIIALFDFDGIIIMVIIIGNSAAAVFVGTSFRGKGKVISGDLSNVTEFSTICTSVFMDICLSTLAECME